MSEQNEAEATIEELIQGGDLRGALSRVEAMLATSDEGGVYVLVAILKCQVGDFDGATATLEAMAERRPEWRVLAQELGYCVDADQIRSARRKDSEVATKRAGIAPPPEFAMCQLAALVHHSQGEHEEAKRMLKDARDKAPLSKGKLVRIDGRVIEFDDLWDSDELTGPLLEAIGPNGLVDIPFLDLKSIEIKPAQTFHDLLWMVAQLETVSGRRLTVRIPAIYPDSAEDETPEVRIGAMTVWDRECGYSVASGQREIYYDNAGTLVSIGLREIARIDFEHEVEEAKTSCGGNCGCSHELEEPEASGSCGNGGCSHELEEPEESGSCGGNCGCSH